MVKRELCEMIYDSEVMWNIVTNYKIISVKIKIWWATINESLSLVSNGNGEYREQNYSAPNTKWKIYSHFVKLTMNEIQKNVYENGALLLTNETHNTMNWF